jgi:cytochrome c556
VAFAHALQDAAGSALAAIDKRDANALLEAGGDLDEACESCHKRFWYPGSPTPPGA